MRGTDPLGLILRKFGPLTPLGASPNSHSLTSYGSCRASRRMATLYGLGPVLWACRVKGLMLDGDILASIVILDV